MRFMSIITSAQIGMPTPELMEAMGKLADREIKSRPHDRHRWTYADGNRSPRRYQGRKLVIVDGPFVEAKEVVGGYAIFEFQNKEEALALTVEFMQLHIDYMPGLGRDVRGSSVLHAGYGERMQTALGCGRVRRIAESGGGRP